MALAEKTLEQRLAGIAAELADRAAAIVAPEPAGGPDLEKLRAATATLAETVATAVNGKFVPRENRFAVPLVDGDAVEVVSPRQGG